MLARDGFRADRQTGTTSGTGRLLECVKCTRQTGVFLEYRADRSSGLAASEGCTPFGGSLRRYWTWAWGSVSVPTSPADDNRLPAPVLAHDPVSTGPAPNGTAQPAARRPGKCIRWGRATAYVRGGRSRSSRRNARAASLPSRIATRHPRARRSGAAFGDKPDDIVPVLNTNCRAKIPTRARPSLAVPGNPLAIR
jgi:hypothetical protein